MANVNILHLSDLGLQAFLDAKAQGVNIAVAKYRLGDSGVAPLDSDQELPGNTLLSGQVGFVEVTGRNFARFTMRISAIEIGSGIVANCIALYTVDNLYIGRALFTTPLELRENESFEISAIIATTRCDLTVIDVTIGEYSSIPSTANLAQLGTPDDCVFNAIVVHDLIENSDLTTSPGQAYKFGAGATQWAFQAHDRIYSGMPTTGSTASSLYLPGLTNNTSFNNGEVVIISVVAGTARGQSRKFYYSHGQQRFLLKGTQAFTGFNLNNTVVVWRSSKANNSLNQYPPNMENIPHDWVLSRGTGDMPVWAPPRNNSKNLNTLYVAPGKMRITPIASMGDGSTSRYGLGNLLVKDVNHCITALSGVVQHKTAYDISSSELEFAEAIPANTPIDFRVITKEPGSGTFVDVVENRYVCDGIRRSFPLSVPIEAEQYAFVYLNHLFQAPSSYTYNPSTQALDFNEAPSEGLVLEISSFVFRQEEGYSTNVSSVTINTVGPTLFIQLPVYPQSINHTFLTLNGAHVNRDAYVLNDNNLIFSSSVPAGSQLECVVFQNVLSQGSPQTSLSGVVVDAVVTHKSIRLFRHDAPDLVLPFPAFTIGPGAGIRVDGEFPNFVVSSTIADSQTAASDVRISARAQEEDTQELISTHDITVTEDIRVMISVDFSSKLGPGFRSDTGNESLEYIIGFRSTGAREPEYGRGIKGTGVAGFSSLRSESGHNEVAFANASMTQVFDFLASNLKNKKVTLVVRARISNAPASLYKTQIAADINVMSVPIVRA